MSAIIPPEFEGVAMQLMFLTRDMTDKQFESVLVRLFAHTEFIREHMLTLAKRYQVEARERTSRKKRK